MDNKPPSPMVTISMLIDAGACWEEEDMDNFAKLHFKGQETASLLDLLRIDNKDLGNDDKDWIIDAVVPESILDALADRAQSDFDKAIASGNSRLDYPWVREYVLIARAHYAGVLQPPLFEEKEEKEQEEKEQEDS